MKTDSEKTVENKRNTQISGLKRDNKNDLLHTQKKTKRRFQTQIIITEIRR